MSDNMSDLRKLRARIEEEAKNLNVKIANLTVTPGATADDPDILNVVFMLTPEAVETAEETEQRKIDNDFESMFGAAFGDTDIFASEETKALLEKEKEEKERREASMRDILGKFDL